MLALLFVYQVSLDCPAVWCSEREVLALEHELDSKRLTNTPVREIVSVLK
jgi:hypothetical protein